MEYVIVKTVKMNFNQAVESITESLKNEGFGIITEINMSKTLNTKLGKDIPPYLILGACNPGYAYKAVTTEPRVGVMLPCNVIVRQLDGLDVEIAAIDPIASMSSINNRDLMEFAQEIKEKLQNAINAL